MKRERWRQRDAAAARHRLLAWAVALLVVTALALAWPVTPLRELAEPGVLLGLLHRFGEHAAAPPCRRA
jgi:hypothetical protein